MVENTSRYQKLYSYVKDFGITTDLLDKCINIVSKKLKISDDEVIQGILNRISSIQKNCIGQAAKHGKELKEYQSLAVKHMLRNRGMIAAFSVGTGKTLTAVTVSSCILNLGRYLNRDIKVVIITPTSLQDNFKKEMKAYGANPKDERYTFYTPTTFGKEYQKGNIDCGKTLLIVDEAHAFRTDYRGIFGDSLGIGKDDTRAEFAIKCAREVWKVLLLTATPIYNQPWDLANLISMVRGIYPPIKDNPYKMIGKPEFDELFRNAILFQESSEEDFPSREDILVEIVMNKQYLRAYEREEEKSKDKKKKKEWYDPATGTMQAEGDDEGGNAFMVKMRKAGNTLNPCLKCDYAMEIIENALKKKKKEKVLFFSEFKESGVDPIIQRLKRRGIGYYLITGSVAKKKRQDMVDDFNSPDGNKVIIITKAGGEGLDLKKVRHVILFEKGWNVSGMEQVIGRAIRYKSHESKKDEDPEWLPPKERNVKVWHLLLLKPSDFDDQNRLPEDVERYGKTILVGEDFIAQHVSDPKKESADLYMFKKALAKERENNELREALQRVQITAKSEMKDKDASPDKPTVRETIEFFIGQKFSTKDIDFGPPENNPTIPRDPSEKPATRGEIIDIFSDFHALARLNNGREVIVNIGDLYPPKKRHLDFQFRNRNGSINLELEPLWVQDIDLFPIGSRIRSVYGVPGTVIEPEDNMFDSRYVYVKWDYSKEKSGTEAPAIRKTMIVPLWYSEEVPEEPQYKFGLFEGLEFRTKHSSWISEKYPGAEKGIVTKVYSNFHGETELDNGQIAFVNLWDTLSRSLKIEMLKRLFPGPENTETIESETELFWQIRSTLNVKDIDMGWRKDGKSIFQKGDNIRLVTRHVTAEIYSIHGNLARIAQHTMMIRDSRESLAIMIPYRDPEDPKDLEIEPPLLRLYEGLSFNTKNSPWISEKYPGARGGVVTKVYSNFHGEAKLTTGETIFVNLWDTLSKNQKDEFLKYMFPTSLVVPESREREMNPELFWELNSGRLDIGWKQKYSSSILEKGDKVRIVTRKEEGRITKMQGDKYAVVRSFITPSHHREAPQSLIILTPISKPPI